MASIQTHTDSPIPFRKLLFLASGPACLLLTLFPAPEPLNAEAWKLIALTLWMVIWWMTEAAPIPVTALLPISLMPMLGILNQKAVGANYGHPLIFLFLGGFLIAAAMRRWNLHRRMALHIVSIIGTGPRSIIAGFMIATAFLSMWISNTATAIMMFAVGMSLVDFVTSQSKDREVTRRFNIALLLGIAYSASIGGVGTIIGTPPNTLLVGFLNNTYDIQIDFLTWMKFGLPFVFIMLPIAWWLLTHVVLKIDDLEITGANELIERELHKLSSMHRGEIIVLIVFCLTALAWILRPLLVKITGLPISDTTIALIAASLLFVLPASLENGQFTVNWDAARDVPWGILILFGGGLALAEAFSTTGLAQVIGDGVAGLSGLEMGWILLSTIVSIIFLTEVTSNTATTATFLPILAAVAVGLGQNPMLLTIPAAVAASMAFMMPVATPPNAIVFAYDELRISDMMKAGFWLNIMGAGLVYLLMIWLAPIIFGLEI